jgi:hypothetical protein
MIERSTERLHFPLDTEHTGIRLALPLIAIFSFVLLLWVLGFFFSSENGGCLNASIAAIGALGVMALSDGLLKRVWKSGRTLTLTDNQITLQDSRRDRTPETHIDLTQRVNVLAWRFTVKRGSARAVRGWIVLALQLVQDETSITLYTLMPAKEADLPQFADFLQLIPRSVIAKGELPLREITQQRRLLQAEDQRWQDGAELRRQDFVRLLDQLNAYQPDWAKG